MQAERFRRELAAQLHIECAMFYQNYSRGNDAAKHIARASALLCFEAKLDGAMGFRLKYQTKATSQLYLSVKHSAPARSGAATEALEKGGAVVATAQLGDESELLEHTRFTEAIDTTLLSATQQALILVLAEAHKAHCADDDLRVEELLAYIERVLRDPTDPVVHLHALVLKSRLELTAKTIERSANQFETIVKSYSEARTPQQVAFRATSFWLAPLATIWEVKKDLGLRLFSLGCVEEALKLFEELRMWDELVHCWVSAGNKQKAEEVCKARLSERRTPAMLCLLGDVTGRLEDYVEAWEVSKHSFARAMRSIGDYHYGKGNYRDALKALTDALKLNPISAKSWYIRGCAALQIKEWSEAATSFSRVVSIDSEDGEAWSNLAAAYLELQRPAEAYRALQEAAKSMPRNWKVLQNLATIGLRLGDLQGAISALRRLAELHQPLDMQLYGVIANLVLRKADRSAAKLYCDLYEYVAKEVASPGSDFWEIGFFFYESIGKYVQSYQYCNRLCLALEGSWDKDAAPARFESVAESHLHLASVCLKTRPGKDGSEQERADAAKEFGKRLSATLTKLKTVASRAQSRFGDAELYKNVVSAIATLEKFAQ